MSEQTPDRLAEIRERHAKALEGPYKPEWDSCDCGPEDGCRNGQRWIYALRMPVPKTTNHTGTPAAWEYLYSELGEFPPDTVLMFAHAREDVSFLLAEVDRLRADYDRLKSGAHTQAAMLSEITSQCMAAELERDARLHAEDVERFLKRERDEHDKGSLAWRDLDDVLDCFRLHMVTGTPLTDPRPEEGPTDWSVGSPPLTEAEELRIEVDRLKAERDQARETATHMAGVMAKVGPALLKATRLIAAGDAAEAAAVLGDVAPEGVEE